MLTGAPSGLFRPTGRRRAAAAGAGWEDPRFEGGLPTRVSNGFCFELMQHTHWDTPLAPAGRCIPLCGRSDSTAQQEPSGVEVAAPEVGAPPLDSIPHQRFGHTGHRRTASRQSRARATRHTPDTRGWATPEAHKRRKAYKRRRVERARHNNVRRASVPDTKVMATPRSQWGE